MLINEDWFVCCVWLTIDYDRLAAISWLSHSTSDFGLSCLPNLECIVSVLWLSGDWLGLVSCLNHYRILTESDCAVILNCYWNGIELVLVLVLMLMWHIRYAINGDCRVLTTPSTEMHPLESRVWRMTKLARLHKPYYGCVIVILVKATLIQIDQVHVTEVSHAVDYGPRPFVVSCN